MPAKNLQRIDEEGLFLHIYNKGVEKRIIFCDAQDYKVFLGFLNDYLSTPKDPESTKEVFKVHGRTFRGTPHQPKNYLNKVELIAYSLMPDHFHLALRQVTKGSIENFIRSLCTRYSIYFNKKYMRTGSLFAGPYKSVMVRNEDLAPLTRFFHLGKGLSSYPEYLRQKDTSWIKPGVVLDFFKELGSYKNFVEQYKPDQKLEKIIFENESDHHLTEPGTSQSVSPEPEIPQISLNPQPHHRINEFITISVTVFALLFTLGIRNIWTAEFKNVAATPITSQVLSTTKEVNSVPDSTDTSEATSEAVPAGRQAKPEKIVQVKADGSSIINIRQKPTTDSIKIGEAKNGDTFAFISKDSDWFEVKLASGETGFISAQYVEEVK